MVKRHAIDNGESIPGILDLIISRITLNSLRKRVAFYCMGVGGGGGGVHLRNHACTIVFKYFHLCNPRLMKFDRL